MAYMGQDKKALIMSRVKAVLPKGWKVTAKIRHHSHLDVIIRQMPRADYNSLVYTDKMAALSAMRPKMADYITNEEIMLRAHWADKDLDPDYGFVPYSEFYILAKSKDGSFNQVKSIDIHRPGASVIEKIMTAINSENFDNSDPQSDYCHCGYYSSLYFGTYDSPLKLVA